MVRGCGHQPDFVFSTSKTETAFYHAIGFGPRHFSNELPIGTSEIDYAHLRLSGRVASPDRGNFGHVARPPLF
jgi:hypothetical protein